MNLGSLLKKITNKIEGKVSKDGDTMSNSLIFDPEALGGWERGIVFRNNGGELLVRIGAFGIGQELRYLYIGSGSNAWLDPWVAFTETGIALKNDKLNTPITSYVNVTSITEYLRYSRYGKLVIIDVGGITFSSTGTGINFITGQIPIMRTRPVCYLFYDRANASIPPVCCHGTIGTQTIRVNCQNIKYCYYGEIIYFTD